MYSITDLKKGTVIQVEGVAYKVVDYNHSSLGRGGAVVRTKLRNLNDGSVQSKTFRGNDKIEPAQIGSQKAQYLYQDKEQAHFMMLDSFEQVGLPIAMVQDQIAYLTEGMEVDISYINDRPISVELPIKIELKVTSADPNVKGDSASNVMKQCEVETGMKISVPLFIEAGDKIRIDTRDGSYIERA